MNTKDGNADFNIADGIESDITLVTEMLYLEIKVSYRAWNFLKVAIKCTVNNLEKQALKPEQSVVC